MKNLKRHVWQISISSNGHYEKGLFELDFFEQAFDEIWCSISKSVNHVSEQGSKFLRNFDEQIYFWS